MDSRLRGNDEQRQSPSPLDDCCKDKWLTTTLGGLITLQRGFDITKAAQSNGVYPVVSSSGITSFHDRHMAKGPGVVIGRKGTLGTAFFIRGDFWPHDTTLWVKDFKGNDEEFIYYLLKSIPLERLDSGSANPTLNRNYAHLLRIAAPIPAVQKKIAYVLFTLDAKIDLNNRINAELEALAKTIYDYWFVQFDFPDANGRPYKSSGGKMVWNEVLKREIPAGWTDGVLTDIANITMGQSPAGDSYNEEGHGVVFFQGSTDFGTRSPDVRMYTTAPGRMAREGDVLVSVRAPVGTLNIADRACCIGRGLAALNSKNGSGGYLYRVMADFKQIFDRRSSEGTTFGSITKGDLFGLKVLIPDTRTLQSHARMANEWIRSSALRDKENRELTRLRDWLLPLLMNGQVRVA